VPLDTYPEKIVRYAKDKTEIAVGEKHCFAIRLRPDGASS
jgi:hypothetical protein